MPDKILIIDDEPEMLYSLERFFKRKGFDVSTSFSGEEGWQLCSETVFDLIISDLAMDGMDGIDLLKQIRNVDRFLPFIIMTGVGTISSAVEATKLGAYHYVTKPFKIQELEILAQRAVEHGKLHRTLESFNKQKEQDDIRLSMVIGNNPVVQEVLATIDKISESRAPVLIEGETGTGKTMFAKRIHLASERREQPFLTIDCGALSEHILESELFGHVKGAFTGAICAKRGLLEEAQGGTIFLDEIGELTPATQVKLLRAIQELKIKPVGGNKEISIDVRFITATNKELIQEIESGKFREDLYYRLAVIPLRLPALRERKEDLLLFVGHFVEKFNAAYRKNITEIEHGVIEYLQEASWKGNIRELENMIERAVLLSSGDILTLEAICFNFKQQVRCREKLVDPPSSVVLKKVVEQAEVQAINRALNLAQGNRTKAASFLGIGRRTLYDKIEAYGIE